MVTNIGGNPQQPMFRQDAFIPDQLIAGDLKLVSENVLISGGALFKRGTLMGVIGAGALAATVHSGPGTQGNGALSSVVPTANAEIGTYKIHFTGPTTYTVTDPTGTVITAGAAAGAYSDAQIGWTFTAGTTAMVAGDEINVAVSTAEPTYTASVSTASDGSETGIAILADDADATLGTVNGGVYLMGEFNIRAVIFGAGINPGVAKAALAARGIFLKSSVSAADPA